MNRADLAKQIDKVYPGLLDEAGHQIEVIQLSGSLNSLYVQLSNSTMVQSVALVDAAGKSGSYASEVLLTQGLQVRELGSKAFVSSTSERLNFGPTLRYYPDVPISSEGHFFLGFDTNDAFSNFVTNTTVKHCRVIDEDLCAKGVLKLDDLIEQLPYLGECERKLMAYVKSLGLEAKVGVFANKTTTYTAGYGWSGSIGGELLSSQFTTADTYNMPEIPGYTRITMMIGSGRSVSSSSTMSVALTTYVSGRADIAHILGSQVYLNGSYKYFDFRIVSGTEYAGDVQVAERYVRGTKVDGLLALSASELKAACTRDVAALNLYNEPSVLLFGPPKVKLFGHGRVMSSALVEDDTDKRAWNLKYTEIELDQFLWVLDKTWYKEYMRTGFGVFTPRNSNIRENVEKQWDDLPFNTLTLRGTNKPFVTSYSVETLPEAVKYGRSRAKACKDNDWLDQIAVKGTTIRWRDVKAKELNSRSRTLWMNDVALDVNMPTVKTTLSSEKVTYRKVDSVITREVEGSDPVTINVASEDHLALMAYDRYYNSNVTLIGGSWDDFILLDAGEKSLLEDKFGEQSANGGEQTGVELVGFSRWIDPTGASDIDHLTDEQRYRLHIKNAVNFDSMSPPLFKVLNSFGYDTLIRYALTK